MKNAHERFGIAEFRKELKDTATRVQVHAHMLIGEPSVSDSGTAQGHLLSVLGSDVDIAALSAAVSAKEPIAISGPDRECGRFIFADGTSVCRGSIQVPGRKRPVRHLIAVSKALYSDSEPDRLIAHDDSPAAVLERTRSYYGLPMLPEWAEWFVTRLRRERRIERLVGLNCRPVAIRGSKIEFLKWIGSGLKSRHIRIPEL